MLKDTNPSETLAKVRQHQTILVDFARLAGESIELQRLLELACHHVARATGVAHSKVMQSRPERGDLLMIAGRGWAPGVVGHATLGIDMQSPPGRAYQTRDLVCIQDLPHDPNFRESTILHDHGIHSVLNAPIAINGDVWGVLEVDSTEPSHFDEDDRCFLRAFALILALAMQQWTAKDDQERHAKEWGRNLLRADTLLTEQNHRVRNYFQFMLAMLANRSSRTNDAQIRAEHAAIMENITAVALAHDQLTARGRTQISAVSYINALCAGLQRSAPIKVEIDCEVEAIELRADRAVPLGLILNELLTNAIKYASKGREQSRIKVRFVTQSGDTEALLEVSDDGPGMGEARPGSAGLKLVASLARQLSGRLQFVSSSEGTAVEAEFPLVE